MYTKTKKNRLIFNKQSYKKKHLTKHGGFFDFLKNRKIYPQILSGQTPQQTIVPGQIAPQIAPQIPLSSQTVVPGQIAPQTIVPGQIPSGQNSEQNSGQTPTSESTPSQFLSSNQKPNGTNVFNTINDKNKSNGTNVFNTIHEQNKSNANLDAIYNASSLLNATTALIPALALTGVGAPAATALGALVVLISKMLELYRNNILLYTAMTDALSIISKSYLLYELILRSYEIISSEQLVYTVKCVGYDEQEFSPQIDDFQNSRLKAKLDELIVLLFGIMRTKDLQLLTLDTELKNSPLGVLLNQEYTKRISDKEKFFNFNKLNRSLLKKLSSEWYIIEFTKTLTYISGILFNIYALNKSHVERIKKESPQNTQKYENKEECSQERINFDNPNITRITQNALTTVKEGDVKGFITGVIAANQIVDANTAANNDPNKTQSEPPKGGSSFRKRKTYKLPRKIIFRHRTF